MNILLMGPRACGKSSIGRRLAVRLDRPWVDLDEAVLARFPEADAVAVWQSHGEAGWRREEAAVLREVLQTDGQVVALGGGTPMIDAARAMLEEARSEGRAVTIYLHCPAPELQRRLREAPGSRPALMGIDPIEEVPAVLAAREPTYRELADLEQEVEGRSVPELVERIAGLLRRRGDV